MVVQAYFYDNDDSVAANMRIRTFDDVSTELNSVSVLPFNTANQTREDTGTLDDSGIEARGNFTWAYAVITLPDRDWETSLS